MNLGEINSIALLLLHIPSILRLLQVRHEGDQKSLTLRAARDKLLQMAALFVP